MLLKSCILICSIILTSCGIDNSKSQQSHPAEPIITATSQNPSIPPISIVAGMTYNAGYIIGGQSNAVYLLESTRDADRAAVFEADIPVNNVVGYAYGNTDIDFWLNSNNSHPLFNIINQYCASAEYFVWWQGESDILEQHIDTYAGKLTQFFTLVKNSCPTIKIIEVTLEYNNGSPTADYTTMQNIQQGFGDYQISGIGYEMQDNLHLTSKGDKDFWTNLTSLYPFHK